jgi:antitoxin FitA
VLIFYGPRRTQGRCPTALRGVMAVHILNALNSLRIGLHMAMLTVRNLDEALKSQLRVRAAQHGRSMEEEARRILREALMPASDEQGVGSRVHRRILELSAGGELELPARSRPRPSPFAQGG